MSCKPVVLKHGISQNDPEGTKMIQNRMNQNAENDPSKMSEWAKITQNYSEW